jgi:hypothetical protein
MLSRYGFALAVGLAVMSAHAQVSAVSCSAPGAYFGSAGGAQFLPMGSGPLMIEAKYTSEQHLADGNRIYREAITHSVTDMHGRTMNQSPRACYREKDGTLKLEYEVTISDPQGDYYAAWTVGNRFSSLHDSKIATVIRRDPLPPLPTPQAGAAAQSAEAQRKLTLDRARKAAGDKSHFEDLGTKNIAGVEAYGWRTTFVTPAGADGNDAPITFTDETWRSLEFGILLASIREDPRIGKTTYEVTQLNRTEPEEAWFAIPADHKVMESDNRRNTTANR